MSRRLLRAAIMAAAVVVLGTSPASAGYSITLNTEFSGTGTANVGFATMEWHNSGGGVLVTLTGLNPAAPNNNFKITEFDFNIKSSAIAGAGITQLTGPTAGFQSPETQFIVQDAFKADGDGFFDVGLLFPNSGTTFGAGSVATFQLTGVTEDDLLDVSVNGPAGKTGFYVAAHVQSIGAGGGQSGWYTGQPGPNPVPAPPSVILAGIGVLGFGGWARLRRKFAKTA